jgi:hypothetical protein
MTFFKSIEDSLVVHVNNGNALDNSMRANLLGPYFNERHWPGRGLLWEFIDLNIRKVSKTLVKHLDYQNDSRDGYNDVAVYCECIHHGDDIDMYKMTYVLTSRKSSGKLIDRVGLSLAK